MKAVLMAGGRGTRIRSIASDIPKPMIPVSGKPVLEYVTECLRDQGFTDIIITVGHMAQYIMDYFGNGDTAELAVLLKGCRMERESLLTALAPVDVERYFNHLQKGQLADLLLQ